MAAVITGSQNGTVGLINTGTAVASTSGTSIDFTGLPAGLKRITVMFSGVSTNGSSVVGVQLGDSGGIETTGYLGSGSQISGTNLTQVAAQTTLFPTGPGGAASVLLHGHVTICLINSATNLWSYSSVLGRADGATLHAGGSKTLSGTLDRVRITTVNGTDTFDAGSINILYE